MSSPSRSAVSLTAALVAALLTCAVRAEEPAPGAARVLRVCADPNALPFSNAKGEGFENRIAEVLASELGARVEYTYWVMKRGFLRNTLKAGTCDVVMGLPAGIDAAATSRPYYRSTYVVVSRKDRALDVSTLDDPRLASLRIGVQMVGAEATNTPPAHALARRGLTSQVVGFPVYGDASRDVPAAAIVEAVERGDVDVAIVWGPLAGWLAARAKTPLSIVPLSPDPRPDALPFAFDIALGVRRSDARLLSELDAALARRAPEIARVLDEYRVPRAEREPAAALAALPRER